MFKKIASFLLCICLISSVALCLCSCDEDEGDNYPVTVADVTIEAEPLNIVVLSDSMADIISYMGYDVKMVGRSVETDQPFLAVVPTVGTATAPDIKAIISYETDLVIAENTLSDSTKKALSNAGIPVLVLKEATSMEELKTLYTNLGTALGGNVTGKTKGEESYDEFTTTLSDYKNAIPSNVVKTACYLYLDEQGTLCSFANGTLEHKLFSYCGAINSLSSQETNEVDLNNLKISTPTYIYYDSPQVLDYLNANSELSSMGALQNGNIYQVKKSDFSRLGTTTEENIYQMISFMFIEDKATPDEATPDTAQTETLPEASYSFS